MTLKCMQVKHMVILLKTHKFSDARPVNVRISNILADKALKMSSGHHGACEARDHLAGAKIPQHSEKWDKWAADGKVLHRSPLMIFVRLMRPFKLEEFFKQKDQTYSLCSTLPIFRLCH